MDHNSNDAGHFLIIINKVYKKSCTLKTQNAHTLINLTAFFWSGILAESRQWDSMAGIFIMCE